MPMSCECIRYDDFGAFANIVLMDRAKNIRMAQRATAAPSIVQLRNAALLDFCACCTIYEDPFTPSYAFHQSFVAVHRKSSVGRLLQGWRRLESWTDESCENATSSNSDQISDRLQDLGPQVRQIGQTVAFARVERIPCGVPDRTMRSLSVTAIRSTGMSASFDLWFQLTTISSHFTGSSFQHP